MSAVILIFHALTPEFMHSSNGLNIFFCHQPCACNDSVVKICKMKPKKINKSNNSEKPHFSNAFFYFVFVCGKKRKIWLLFYYFWLARIDREFSAGYKKVKNIQKNFILGQFQLANFPTIALQSDENGCIYSHIRMHIAFVLYCL